MREHELQQSVAQYLALTLPPEAFCTAIDHGAGKMSAISGALRKARGVVKGIPDIVIIWDHKCLWIELKTLTGRLSDDQRIVRDKILAAGFDWSLARSLVEVEMALHSAGIPTRARVSLERAVA